MSIFHTEGIVLHQFELGEADRIITFYTRERGKVRAVAKGVRKTRSNQAAATQLFTYAELIFYQGKELDSLNQVQIKESFVKLREDLTRMAYGAYALELVKELTVEGESNEGMFILLLQTLHLLAEVDQLELIIRIFEVRALTLMGFRPVLEHCIQCTDPLPVGKVQFHPEMGGLVCHQCHPEVRGTITINRGTVEFMKRFLDASYRQLLKLKLPDYARKELEQVMEPFIEYHLDRHLKSLEFLKSLKSMEK